MAFTPEQQAQIDAAQKRLESAKEIWALWTERWTRDVYNRGFSGMRCYEGQLYPIADAATWFQPAEISCGNNNDYNECKIGKGGKNDCKDSVKNINTNYIPSIRTAYKELNDAQTNLSNVLNAIEQQVQNDPDLITELEQIEQNATQAGITQRTKIIWFSVIAVTVIILGFILIRRFAR